MKLGLFDINQGPRAVPEALGAAAMAVEDAGFESVCVGEPLMELTRSAR